MREMNKWCDVWVGDGWEQRVLFMILAWSLAAAWTELKVKSLLTLLGNLAGTNDGKNCSLCIVATYRGCNNNKHQRSIMSFSGTFFAVAHDLEGLGKVCMGWSMRN